MVGQSRVDRVNAASPHPLFDALVLQLESLQLQRLNSAPVTVLEKNTVDLEHHEAIVTSSEVKKPRKQFIVETSPHDTDAADCLQCELGGKRCNRQRPTCGCCARRAASRSSERYRDGLDVGREVCLAQRYPTQAELDARLVDLKNGLLAKQKCFDVSEVTWGREGKKKYGAELVREKEGALLGVKRPGYVLERLEWDDDEVWRVKVELRDEVSWWLLPQ